METTATTTEKEVVFRMYCATCGEEILCYDDGTTSIDYETFEDSENTPYCLECYDEERDRREAQERADLEQYFTDKNSIQNILNELDVEYEYHLASTGTMYWNCEFTVYNDDDECEGTTYFKVRLADHSQCYDADYNVATCDNNQDGTTLEGFKSMLTRDLEAFRDNCLNK